MVMDKAENNDIKKLLKEALSLWWLRPENALALSSYCIRGSDLRPSANEIAADFACGDGVNTFFKCGGRFDLSFDIFGNSVNPATAKDIASKSIDIFDYDDGVYQPAISKMPDCRFSYGTDHKKKLLNKANKLFFYDKLLHCDLNVESDIDDESLDYAYCNSIYWISDPIRAIGLIIKKIKPGGRLIFDVMTKRRSALNFESILPQMPKQWNDLMNRGRQHNNPGICDEEEWDELFEYNNQTKIAEKRDIFPTAIAIVWNIGLRPLFPILNRMAKSISKEMRNEIKLEWIDTVADLLYPVLISPGSLIPTGPAVRLQYIVKKL
jgi:SAM-dependent methyltransferase